jgi:DegV family protein with EDD domain
MKTTYKVYEKQGDENMRDFILSCCSTVDLTKEYLEKRDIHFISLHFEVDGKAYTDDFGESISAEHLYEAMLAGSETKTSQVNAMEFEEYFETFLKEGKDILHLSVSSGVSGTFNSANIAKMELEERYPERKIFIVDSLGGSSGSGMMVEALADMRDEGKSIEELYTWIEAHKLELQHWLFSTDLTFFVKGGRISKTSGFVGNLLNICPLIDVSVDGKLTPRRKVRTKKKVMEAIVDFWGAKRV